MVKPTSTADKHQFKILVDTVKNPAKGMFLGGPDATEAEAILRKKFKFTDQEISKLKESVSYGRSKLIESAVTKITKKVMNEGSRDTTWAVKMIDEFIAANESAMSAENPNEQYHPKMKLFANTDSKFFTITFDELKQISALLRRLNRGAKR